MSNADPGRARPVFQWLAQPFAPTGKEGKQIIPDPSSFLGAGLPPMIFLLLFGYRLTLAARVLDISQHLLYALLRSRQIRSLRVGRIFRVPRCALEEYLGLAG